MKGVKRFELEIADKSINKESVIDAFIKRYHVCEEVVEAMVWDNLCTAKGLQCLFNVIDNNEELSLND